MKSKDRGLRVLITTSTFPYSEGDGQARFILDLALALSKFAEIQVLAPHAPGAKRHETVGSVKIRRFRYFAPSRLQRLAYGSGMRHNIGESLWARLQVPCLLLAQTMATASIVWRDRVSVLNAHWLVPQGLSAAVVSLFLGVPMVLHVHAADVYFLKGRFFGPAIARFAVRNAASVLADGSHVRDSLNELIGFESGAHLRPMGVWVDVFKPSSAIEAQDAQLPSSFVIFIGRLVEKKGVEYLIKALPLVRSKIPDLQLVVVGVGPLKSDLVRVAGELGISDEVHFLGSRQHHEVAALLRTADVACVPSIIDSKGETEGMPTVVLEALAAGARVVGTRVNGIPDVLDHAENGWLVQPADERSLAAGLLEALTQPEAETIADRATATAARHHWPHVAEEYLGFLRGAADV